MTSRADAEDLADLHPGVGPGVVALDERHEDSPLVDVDMLASVLRGVLAAEGAPGSAEVALTLVDPERIAALKVEHLDGDGMPTDVLSFPLDGVAEDAELIGDVVVCVQIAETQAPGHAGTLEDELALLVVHGALHLAGWDHEDEAQRSAMWERERTLMTKLHRPPTRDPWGDTPR